MWQNYKCLTIYGSLAKYLNDENITPLSRKEVKQAIKKLEQDIGLSLKDAIVCSVEFGTSIIVKEKPFEYLKLFGYTNRLARHIISNGNINRTVRREVSTCKGVETVIYTTKNGSHGFIGYDKIKEMFVKDKKYHLPIMGLMYSALKTKYGIEKE
jgi:DNA-binding Lrp family transcriptional regulator